MQPDELRACVDLFEAGWSGTLTLAERELWMDSFDPYPRQAVMSAIREAREHFPRRPGWADLKPLIRSARAQLPAPQSRVDVCDCDGIFVETTTGVIPCEFCQPEMLERHRSGYYRPTGLPKSHDAKPLDRESFQRGIDEARGELIKRGVSS